MRSARNVAITAAALWVGGESTELAGQSMSGTVALRNSAGVRIEHVYTVPAEDLQWGQDLLGSIPLLAGQTRVVPQVPCEERDVKLVDSAGRECVLESLYLCVNKPFDLPPEQAVEGADGTWDMRPADLAGCPGFGQ